MILFWLFGIVAIASAVWTVSASKPVYSVVGLLVNFAALAALYLSLNAEFLAVIQIIVYSGAILVLFVFVIALLSSGVGPFAQGPNRLPKIVVPAVVLAFVSLGFVVYAFSKSIVTKAAFPAGGSNLGPVGDAGVFGSVADFGKALFTVQLLPFEVTALILMVAIVGVVLLAGDRAPYVPTRKRAGQVERSMREAILRGGKE